jgi:hypothetical protein
MGKPFSDNKLLKVGMTFDDLLIGEIMHWFGSSGYAVYGILDAVRYHHPERHGVAKSGLLPLGLSLLWMDSDNFLTPN